MFSWEDGDYLCEQVRFSQRRVDEHEEDEEEENVKKQKIMSLLCSYN